METNDKRGELKIEIRYNRKKRRSLPVLGKAVSGDAGFSASAPNAVENDVKESVRRAASLPRIWHSLLRRAE